MTFRSRLGRSVWLLICAITTVAALVVAVHLQTARDTPPADFGSRPSAGHGDTGGASGQVAGIERGLPRTDSPRDPAESAPPVRLGIPRLRVDSEVRPVGLARNGTVAVPDDAGTAGWYRYGPAPGAPAGSAVLVGHVDSRTGRLGALAALHDVRAGDGVIVQRKGAAPVRFTVVSREVHARNRLPDDLFRRDGKPVLTLITCTVPYDREHGGYRNNLIVTAAPVRK